MTEQKSETEASTVSPIKMREILFLWLTAGPLNPAFLVLFFFVSHRRLALYELSAGLSIFIGFIYIVFAVNWPPKPFSTLVGIWLTAYMAITGPFFYFVVSEFGVVRFAFRWLRLDSAFGLFSWIGFGLFMGVTAAASSKLLFEYLAKRR